MLDSLKYSEVIAVCVWIFALFSMQFMLLSWKPSDVSICNSARTSPQINKGKETRGRISMHDRTLWTRHQHI